MIRVFAVFAVLAAAGPLFGGRDQASAAECVEVTFSINPVGAGVVSVDPPFDCPGGYESVAEFYADAIPEEGYRFAGFTPANITTSHLFQVTGEPIHQTASFARTLDNGVAKSIPEPLPQGRYYHFETHEGDERIEVTKTGPISATLYHHNQFGQPFCIVPADQSCEMDDPYVGNWWLFVERTGEGEATVTATITSPLVCHALTVRVNPPEGGTVDRTPTGTQGCPEGEYAEGTEVTLHSTPNQGFVLAEAINSGINQDRVVVMTNDQDVRANFAVPLADGVEQLFSGVAHGEVRTGYIDVPPGTTSLRATFTALDDGFYGYLYPPELNFSCYIQDNSPADVCAQNEPAAGRWWLSIASYNGDDVPPTDTLSLKATLGDEPICWSITATAFPPGAAVEEPRLYPPPNCGDGYLPGAFVQIIPGEAANPDLSPAFFQRDASGANRADYEIAYGDAEITVHYAERLLPGTSPGLDFDPGGFQSYFVDIPTGVTSMVVEASGPSGLLMNVGPWFGHCETNVPPLICQAINPDADRWFIAFVGEQQGTTDVTITLSPGIAATVSSVTPSVIYFGQSEPVQLTVTGFGFDPGEVVYFAGTPLSTMFVGTNQLLAEVPVNLLPAQMTYVDVWVGPPPEQTLTRDIELPSNSFRVFHTRPSSDVDCSGALTGEDALGVLLRLAGLPVQTCWEDVNLDGTLSLADAIRARQEVAGLVGPLPMPLEQ